MLLDSLDTFVRRQYEVIPSFKVDRVGWFRQWGHQVLFGGRSTQVGPKKGEVSKLQEPSSPRLAWVEKLEREGLQL